MEERTSRKQGERRCHLLKAETAGGKKPRVLPRNKAKDAYEMCLSENTSQLFEQLRVGNEGGALTQLGCRKQRLKEIRLPALFLFFLFDSGSGVHFVTVLATRGRVQGLKRTRKEKAKKNAVVLRANARTTSLTSFPPRSLTRARTIIPWKGPVVGHATLWKLSTRVAEE